MVKKAPPEHDPINFSNDLDRIMAVLENLKQQGSEWLTATQISASLRDIYGIGIHWRRVESLLQNNRDLADRRKRDRHWQYMVLHAGRDRLSSSGSSIVFIDPAKAMQATLSLHSFLQSLSGTARICDPYLDPTTLDHLSACAQGLTIKLLTKNLKDPGRVRTLLAAARTEGRNLDVRVAASEPLHDRYIIDDNKMLILGTSLNGFGKKQGFIVQAGEDVRCVVILAFDNAWAIGAVWS